jgi:hypothetical protein
MSPHGAFRGAFGGGHGAAHASRAAPRPPLGVVAAVASLAMLFTASMAAAAGPSPPADIRVGGGEETWHPENRFRLDWTNPDPGTGTPIAAVHYRVLDPLGGVAVGETRIGWAAELIDNLRVPYAPGAYTAEVWLEDAAGNQGAPAAARLRFDNVRPGHAEPAPDPAWIGRTAFPYTLRIGHPEGEAPVSGIRGYAVSVDSSPQGDPCAAVDRCTDAETDLRGGAGDDALPIVELPEGVSYVHVAAVSGSGLKSATPGSTVLHVDETDPVTRLAGAPGGWTSQPVTLTATATDGASGMAAGGPGESPFTAIQVDGGTPTVAAGASVEATVIAEGAHTVAFYARDAAGNVDDGATANGLSNRSPSTALVRIDRGEPAVSFVAHQDPRDPELIRVQVLDSLSGPDPSRGWIGVRRAGSGDRFEALPLEPGSDGPQARWDSDGWPPGDYEFRATGYDAAGNFATASRRSNGAAMVLSNPLKTTTTLFGGRRAERFVPYGRGALFSGRLVAGLRTPLPRMPVRIVERFGPGSSDSERVSTVWTDGEGSFAAPLAPGPSREVVAVFAGTPTLTRSATRPARLRVRSGVRLRVSSNVATVGGRPLLFRGRVGATGCGIPAGGKAVELQFKLPGLPWSEFRTVQTDARGRFRYAYRFSDDDSRGARFRFRAYAPAQGGWPYEPGGSRAVAVRGR